LDTPYDNLIKEACDKYDLDFHDFRKLLHRESRFDPEAKSPVGAVGLGQVMPGTAKLYGVKDLEDLKDPAKSIDLSAHILSDCIRYAGGDWNAALAQYNGGTSARKAYQKGNFKDMPKETQEYVLALGKPVSFNKDRLIKKISELNTDNKKVEPSVAKPETPVAKPEVTIDRYYGAGSNTVKFADPEAVYKKAPESNVDVGFTGGLTHSWFATLLKKELGDKDIFGMEQYIPTEEEAKSVLELFDWDTDKAYSVFNGASSKEDLAHRINIIKETSQYRSAEANADFTDALLSGLGSSVSDPLTYVPAFGQVGLVGRVSIGAISGALSNQADRYVAGTDNSFIQDVAMGSAIGFALETAFPTMKGAGKVLGNSYRRGQQVITNIQNNAQTNPNMFNKSVSAVVNTFRDNAEKLLPVWTLRGAKTRAVTDGVKGFWDKAFKDERGTKTVDANGNVIYKQFASNDRTAEEVKRVYVNQTNRWADLYNDNYTKLNKLGYSNNEIDSQIMDAIEGGIQPPLMKHKEFKDLVDATSKLLDDTGAEAQARGLLGDLQFTKGRYVPMKINRLKVADALDNIGGSRASAVAKLQKKISNLLVKSLNDPEVYTRMRQYWETRVLAQQGKPPYKYKKNADKAFNNWIKEQADKDALGYVDQGEGLKRGLFDDDPEFNSSYSHDRTPWGTNVKDVDGFSVNDLRSSVYDTVSAYRRRTTGDFTMNEVYGYTGYRDALEKMGELAKGEEQATPQPKGQAKPDDTQRNAMVTFLKDIYGESLKDHYNQSSYLAAVSDVLRNLTFATKNTFMGILNYTEVAEGIKAYGGTFLIKSIPAVNKLASNWSKGYLEADSVKGLQNLIFGKQFQQLEVWRNISERQSNRFADKRFGGVVSKIVAGSEWVANASPFTKFLQASQESIVGTAQGQFIAELSRFAHKRSSSTSQFLDPKVLKRLNISDADFKYLLKIMKNLTKMDSKGNITMKGTARLLMNNNRALATLRRMGDYVADEVIQRNSLSDTFLWSGSKRSPLMDLVFQFKTFAIRSYNKRLAKMGNRIEEGEGASQALTLAISGGLATMGDIGITALITIGMSEEERKNYMQYRYGIDSFGDLDSEAIANIALAGSSRSGIIAAPMMLANMAGINTGSKTTADINYADPDEATLFKGITLQDIARTFLPSYGLVSGASGLVTDLANLGMVNIFDEDFDETDVDRVRRNMARDFKSVSPKLPLIQNELYNIIKGEQ